MGAATSYNGIVGLEHAYALRKSASDLDLLQESKVQSEMLQKSKSDSDLIAKSKLDKFCKRSKMIRPSFSADEALLKMRLDVASPIEVQAGAPLPLPETEVSKCKSTLQGIAGIAGVDESKFDSSFSTGTSITVDSAHAATCPRQLILLVGPGRKENRKILNDWNAAYTCAKSPEILGDGDAEYKVVMPMHWKSLKCKEVTELQSTDDFLDASPSKPSLLRCPVIVYTMNFQFYKDKSFGMRTKLLQRIEGMMTDFEEMTRLNWVKKSSVVLLTIGIPRTQFFGKIFGKEFDDMDEFFDIIHSAFLDKFSKMTFVNCSSLHEFDLKSEVDKNIALFHNKMTGRSPLTASSALSTPGTAGSSMTEATPGKFDPAAEVPLSVLELVNSIDDKLTRAIAA